MFLRDAQTIQVSDMSAVLSVLAQDSVILLVSATKMVRIYFFTSSLLRYRGKEAEKCLRLSGIAMFACGTESSRYSSDP